MGVEYMAVALFICICLALMAGYPVAFTLGGMSLLFAGGGIALNLFDPSFLGALPSRLFGTMNNQTLLAVPLFVFMGVMLEKSRIAEDLLDAMSRLFGGLRGGLAFSVCIVGALSLSDPPSCVSRKFVTSPIFKFIYSFHEPNITFLN